MDQQRSMSWGDSSVSPQPSQPTSQASPPAAPSKSPCHPPRIRRRNRMITSCLECRRRKLKCNKDHPCLNCVRASRDCVFLAPALDSASQSKLTEIKDKVGSLERSLEEQVALKGATSIKQEEEDETLEVPEDERDLEPTPLAVSDAIYEGDGDDEFFDLGIQFGKMRLGDRVGGFFRPRIAEELSFAIIDVPAKDRSSPGNDPRTLDPTKPLSDYSSPPASLDHLASTASVQESLKPGPTYTAPSSTFFLGIDPNHSSLIDFLPSKTMADRLKRQYFEAVEPICRCVHRPTFERQYRCFWTDVASGVEPAPSIQAVVLAALFSGVISLDDNMTILEFGAGKLSLVENFRLATETALAKANFLRSTKLETLQAFVLYLIPLCRDQVSRAHSALVGTVIRIAQCMGLHRDGDVYQLPPIETHIRRLIWHEICFLDLRTCEAQGPQPSIRKEEYDTKVPLDVDDVDLMKPGRIKPTGRWTDATYAIIRFRATEMHRVAWVDRPRVEKKQISLIHILRKIENWRKSMEEKYFKIIDDRVPIQRLGKFIMKLLTCRLHVMVLHRYLLGAPQKIPDRFRQLIITNGTQQMELAIQLETDPALTPWLWYSGAYQQYHTALLLLNEVFCHPTCREADRIWACCDYVFETDPALPRDEKARAILSAIQARSAAYRDLRKMRATQKMEGMLGAEGLKRAAAMAADREPHGLRPSTGSTSSGSPLSSGLGLSPHDGTASLSETSSNPAVAIASGGYGESVDLQDDIMADIDWNEWDKLFPPDVVNEMSFPMGRF